MPYKCSRCGKEMQFRALYCSKDCKEAAKPVAVTTGGHTKPPDDMRKETHRCPVCGVLFFPKRSDAIYCSARCRKRAQRKKTNRAKNEQQAVYRQALSEIAALRGMGAYTQLRMLVISLIEDLPDDQRSKLYDSITTDFYRIRDSDVTHK